ncbi:MAG TPA: hypothetical protein PLJ10_04230 [Candidatus Hydrogenedens sp.]|nr:hypothetical protein [Candidatus Hydrogenedens sp.]
MMYFMTLLLILKAWELPAPIDKEPVPSAFFKDRLHTYIWLNWSVVPTKKIAETIGAKEEDILSIGKRMGLPDPPHLTTQELAQLHCTIIRRNWHLLPYEQIMKLLGWNSHQLAYTLREDDFLFIKLGNFKPKCEPLIFEEPDKDTIQYEEQIGNTIKRLFPNGISSWGERPLHFIEELKKEIPLEKQTKKIDITNAPTRYCSSYFLHYGDPFSDLEKSYPMGYIQKLHELGVNGIWLQAVLYLLTPFPWDPSISEGWEKRLENLSIFSQKLKNEGVNVFLYLNEPRAMPNSFYEKFPELKGVNEGDFSALCTSNPDVQNYIKNAIKMICEKVPELGGFFTISASENLTNCWSHHHGENCPRCSKRNPSEVIAEVHQLIQSGIDSAHSSCKLIAWDWGWRDDWVEGIISNLPSRTAVMSVSEWDISITRGGVNSVIGEYSLTEPGPGPRASRHWEIAKKYNHPTFAKLQIGTTWELGSVPYIPVLENVATHAIRLREKKLDGFMLGWTLGGYPSPNIQVFNLLIDNPELDIDNALKQVAEKRFGQTLAPIMVKTWKHITQAFKEYPFHIIAVYQCPVQVGPSNPLWAKPTGYNATMTGFPYDDVKNWCGNFPPEIFANQMEKMARGFNEAILTAKNELKNLNVDNQEHLSSFENECRIIEVCASHFQAVANQTRFVLLRNKLLNEQLSNEEKTKLIAQLREILNNEMDIATKEYLNQLQDSRIGFEATNHYFYVPLDLVLKVMNCKLLLNTWLPELTTSAQQ